MSRFKDHFSSHAADYSRFRPTYPAALFAHLAALAPAQRLAWDAGTGNGQAARALADHFERVIATDASVEQIASATPHPRIEYRTALAESSRLPAAGVDLATVAQALHWFDIPRYFAEVQRVLRPGGIVAVWTYTLVEIAPPIDALLQSFYAGTVGACWPPERALTDDHYRGIAFPFEELRAPQFAMQAQWTLEQLAGYLRTWSATQRYRREHGADPVGPLHSALAAVWGDPQTPRRLRWPLGLRIGRRREPPRDPA